MWTTSRGDPKCSDQKKSKRTFPFEIPIKISGIFGKMESTQNCPVEIRKFLGVDWIATGLNGLVPFHSQNEFRVHVMKMKDVGSLLLTLKLDDDFDGDINSIV